MSSSPDVVFRATPGTRGGEYAHGMGLMDAGGDVSYASDLNANGQPADYPMREGGRVVPAVQMALAHQSLVVAQSWIGPNSTQCKDSTIILLRFYSSKDKTLGSFLREELVSLGRCATCRAPSSQHTLSFAHQRGSVDICVFSRRDIALDASASSTVRHAHTHACTCTRPHSRLQRHTRIIHTAAWRNARA